MTFVTSVLLFRARRWVGSCYLPSGFSWGETRVKTFYGNFRSILCLLLLATFVSSSTAQSTGSDGSKLLVLEHMWNEAQVQRDAHALEGLIGDHFVDTEYDGEVSDRQKFLADIANPEFQPTSMSLRDTTVMMYKETAVITGIYHAKGVVSGKPYDHTGRFTDTWVLQDGRWLCVASHTSLVKK